MENRKYIYIYAYMYFFCVFQWPEQIINNDEKKKWKKNGANWMGYCPNYIVRKKKKFCRDTALVL